MYLISVVIPVYKAEKIVDALIERLTKSLDTITSNYEIILVEDGSPDLSWSKIEPHCKSNTKIKGIKLSRNFGQHHAITAGLDHAKGEWIVVMDCDLQDLPEEIIKLYSKAKDGYDVVLAQRLVRHDTFLKRLFSKLFYRTLGYLTGSSVDESIANFGVYNKKAIEAVINLRESIRYFPTMIKWVGFKQVAIPVKHAERYAGKSSYDYKKLINLALDIILAYSDKPIRLMIKLGVTVSLIAFLFGIFFLIEYFTGNVTVQGYTSLIISIWFFSGLILIMLGMIGLYIGKTFEGVRNRPIYLINDRIND